MKENFNKQKIKKNLWVSRSANSQNSITCITSLERNHKIGNLSINHNLNILFCREKEDFIESFFLFLARITENKRSSLFIFFMYNNSLLGVVD